MTRGISKTTFIQVGAGDGYPVDGAVPIEEQVVLSVNAIDLVGLRCTPLMLEDLAVGFLFNEGFIDGISDVADVRVCGTGRCLDVWLNKDIEPPAMRTITSGCSGGTTFESLVDASQPLSSDLTVTSDQIVALMRQMQVAGELYRRSRGIHTSALAEGDRLLCLAEDVGRHNTLDKISGSCLRRGQPTADRILLTSGRVSSEMLSKAAQMAVPVVASMTSPTSLSVELAQAWDVALIGYVRGPTFRIYAGADRVEIEA